jgi:hypothetical protein
MQILEYKKTIAYVLVHILTNFAIRYHLRDLIKAQENPELRKKYAPFMRKDLHLLNLFKGFPWWLLAWPRLLAYVFWLIACFMLFQLSVIFHKDMSKIKDWQKELCKFLFSAFSRGALGIAYGYWNIKETELDVDYSPWLGPDWKPAFDPLRAPTLITNHVSGCDIYVSIYMHRPSFVARATVKKLPFIGKSADFLNSVYVDRLDKSSRSNTMDKIAAYQQNYLTNKSSHEKAENAGSGLNWKT